MPTYTVFYANLLYGTFEGGFSASQVPDGAFARRSCGQWLHIHTLQVYEIPVEEVPPQTRLTALLLGL